MWILSQDGFKKSLLGLVWTCSSHHILIKRYPNRKFYDTEQKRYIILEDISERIRSGREIQVIEQSSGEDITSVILSQIIFEQEKKQTGFVPRSVLAGLVTAGGFTVSRMRKALTTPLELLKQVNEEIEQRIELLIEHGELAEDEARRWRDKLLNNELSSSGTGKLEEDEIQRLLDERGVPTSTDLESLSQQLEELMKKLDELESNSGG
jgi:polyhydroxyalkanoate synthesis repressor PhaR